MYRYSKSMRQQSCSGLCGEQGRIYSKGLPSRHAARVGLHSMTAIVGSGQLKDCTSARVHRNRIPIDN